MLEAIAPCHEYIFQMRTKIVLLYGATTRVIGDGVCQIAVFRHHVTLTFPEGIDLQDPAGRLRGTGATMRHIRIATSDDLTHPEIRALLLQARALADPAGRPPRARRKVVTRIKTRADRF